MKNPYSLARDHSHGPSGRKRSLIAATRVAVAGVLALAAFAAPAHAEKVANIAAFEAIAKSAESGAIVTVEG